MVVPGQRENLYIRGVERALEFCSLNELEMPELRQHTLSEWRFDACAYYRPTYIAICLAKCQVPGTHARNWSWPGYVVDRTPYGVIQHELGHHVDITLSGMTHGYQGEYSVKLRRDTEEPKLTNYCPNDAEWFAEIFRLFVTNPDLLRLLRPRTYARLVKRFEPVSNRNWKDELEDAPTRYFNAAKRKIENYYDEPGR